MLPCIIVLLGRLGEEQTFTYDELLVANEYKAVHVTEEADGSMTLKVVDIEQAAKARADA